MAEEIEALARQVVVAAKEHDKDARQRAQLSQVVRCCDNAAAAAAAASRRCVCLVCPAPACVTDPPGMLVALSTQARAGPGRAVDQAMVAD
jgi:hypothetical protein